MTDALRVGLGERSYDIIIGQGLLARAGELLQPLLRRPRVIIVTDETVAPLYAASLESSLKAHSIMCQRVALPAGEKTKSFSGLEHLMDALFALSPDRFTTLLALGGGVVGDITGFAASILLRGVDFIQVPTTLLAQVDSAVGGKTGINTKHGKNLIGSFYQPKLVIADISTFESLPRRQLLAGYAEVVKYGVINDAAFFAWLEQNGEAALTGDKKALAHVVRESCKAKADIVGQDERESGMRMLLNFGHTLGHAFEADAGFSSTLLHGEAVSIGMVLALRLSVMRGLCKIEEHERVRAHLAKVGLPTKPSDIRHIWDAKSLIRHCTQDKKARDGGLTFILAEKIGKTNIFHDVKTTELEALLAEML
jgi:3-dehydroquinate synthase